MKAISIREPYASLIAEGRKKLETRGRWPYKYRGDILIHASAKLGIWEWKGENNGKKNQ